MRIVLITFALMCFTSLANAGDALELGNDSWPPFVLQGEDQGTSERLVCEALSRAVDAIREKFGRMSIRRGSSLKDES